MLPRLYRGGCIQQAGCSILSIETSFISEHLLQKVQVGCGIEAMLSLSNLLQPLRSSLYFDNAVTPVAPIFFTHHACTCSSRFVLLDLGVSVVLSLIGFIFEGIFASGESGADRCVAILCNIWETS